MLPPTETATNTHIPGNPTLFPTTFGYIKLPSICCNINTNTTNVITLNGLTDNISIDPTITPIKAPTIGINAVTPIKILIGIAYGIFSINIPIQQRIPNILASKHCTVKKFLNIELATLPPFIIFSDLSFGKYACNIFLLCSLSFSLSINTYIAKIIAIKKVAIPPIIPFITEIDEVNIVGILFNISFFIFSVSAF